MGPLQGNDDAPYVSTGPSPVAILAVMTTAGMYEASGDRLYDVGVPGA